MGRINLIIFLGLGQGFFCFVFYRFGCESEGLGLVQYIYT